MKLIAYIIIGIEKFCHALFFLAVAICCVPLIPFLILGLLMEGIEKVVKWAHLQSKVSLAKATITVERVEEINDVREDSEEDS